MMIRACRRWTLNLLTGLLIASVAAPSGAGEARERWERMNQIRHDKFDLILPEAMRENGFDMWIVMRREGYDDPLTPDLGGGYVSTTGYYVFTDRGGDRIERAALGISGYLLEASGTYDHFGPVESLRDFVAEREPKRIGVNISRAIGAADGLTHSGYLELREVLGAPWADRLEGAEKLVSDFRSRRVASEIAAYAEAGEISRLIAERAFSNEVITPGETTLEDVAWWMHEQTFQRGLGLSFGQPSVYITGPGGIEAISTDRVIRRGDVLMLDWGVGFLNFYTDLKRIAYVLKDGETEVPAELRHAYDRAAAARAIVKRTIRAGLTAAENEQAIYDALIAAGFVRIGFNQPTENPETTDGVIGCHSVGNTGHGIGPSIAFFNPVRLTYEVTPSNLLAIELFAYTALPSWDGAKLRVPLEDDAVVTERGVEWLYPISQGIRVIR
ncbi:MAG: M24 family metallopeptidase [Acidobacteriota bacterium]